MERENKMLKDKKISVKFLVISALVAALYVALTLIFAPISFMQLQFRVSEILTLLPIVSLPAVPGLFVGCLIANLIAGALWQDVIFGSLATFLAAVLTRFLRKLPWFAAFMPVLVNGIVVGLLLVHVYALPIGFWAAAGSVAIGEAAVVYMLGLPFIGLIKKALDPKKLEGEL